FCFYFFFQAEDGIRDLIVTGVQTCALPILECFGQIWVRREMFGLLLTRRAREFRSAPSGIAGIRWGEPELFGLLSTRAHQRTRRSEERRVGKECRARRATK